MKNILSSFVKEFIKVVIIVAIAVPTIALFAAWTGPTGAPPTNNADAPVNVGGTMQTKLGLLNVRYLNSFYDTYLATISGNVGIGAISPQTPAPNGNEGNVDVNDVYLRSTGQWVSESSTKSFTCTQAKRQRSTLDILSGDSSAVQELNGTKNNGKRGGYWGLECVNDYQKTGCHLSNKGIGDTDLGISLAIKTDNIWAVLSHPNGCTSDEEEWDQKSSMYISCCKIN